MNNKKFFRLLHAAALFTALSLFAVLTFEVFHEGYEANCQEENCPVCLVLQIIHNTNKITNTAAQTSVDFSIFDYINLFIFSALLLAPATLVRQKVKLVI